MGEAGGAGTVGEVAVEAWDAFVDGFLERYFAAHPTFAAAAGRHDFDGLLPDWSPEGLAAEAGRLREERRKAAAFDPAALDAERRFERDALLAQIDGELFWWSAAEAPLRNPLFYSAPLDPALYLTREYAPLQERLRAYVAYARAVPRAAAEIRANLRTPLPRTFVELGRLTFGGLADYYEREAPAAFAAVRDPWLESEFKVANAAAAAAMRELDAWLAAQEGEANGDFRLGASLFSEMLAATERVEGVSLAELEAAGRADLERNLGRLEEACAAYAPGLTVAECISRINREKPEGGPPRPARRQLAGLKAFVVEQGLAGIPGDEQALVAEAPPHQRWNSAYIDIPGPHERGMPAIYYISPPDPAWTAEEREAYIPGAAELLFTSVHEVWPGHFLQFLHSNRAASPIGRTFVSYGFAEGWAHYAEEMVWEAGFGAGDPRVQIGLLQNALLRNVRYVVAIGLHAGEMTLAEAERRFREQGHLDAASARQQAARGTFDPAYLNYTLGKLMVRKLRDDWTAPRGGRAAWRAFHDRLLSFGGPPLPLVRREMLGGVAGSLL
ncbi:MAG TPA: DUF885 domain-containing protein [Thermoanaerobaculia bacterium]|nr:DUF885 domain-containing protein [Thermoanaerobaculia bacterium]